MARLLSDDPLWLDATLVVIDFEATTPRGCRPEPIEVAAVVLRPHRGQLVKTDEVSRLMCPPPHAPITRFDIDQTGLRPENVVHQPPAGQVLSELDDRLTGDGHLLVAHHAHVEAGLLYDYRAFCPRLATTHLLDTVRLSRAVYPGLISYGLDHLMSELRIPRPVNRHRALPDVHVTVELLTRALTEGCRRGVFDSLAALRRIAELVPRATRPEQQELF